MRLTDFFTHREYLDLEITPSQERVHEVADQLLDHYNCFISKMRSVLLVEDLVDSIKVSVLLLSLSFISLLTTPIVSILHTHTVPVHLLVSHLHWCLVQRPDLGYPCLHRYLLATEGVRAEQGPGRSIH